MGQTHNNFREHTQIEVEGNVQMFRLEIYL